jgi:hypothetical protein
VTNPLTDDESHGFAAMLEKMPSMDLLTLLVLGFDAYMLYTQLEYYNRDAIFQLTTNLPAVALQTTLILIAIYVVEFMHDRKKDRRR